MCKKSFMLVKFFTRANISRLLSKAIECVTTRNHIEEKKKLKKKYSQLVSVTFGLEVNNS